MDSMTTIEVLRQEVYDAAYRYYMDLHLDPSKTPNTYFIYVGVEELAGSILRGGSRDTYPDMADDWLDRIVQKAKQDVARNTKNRGRENDSD